MLRKNYIWYIVPVTKQSLVTMWPFTRNIVQVEQRQTLKQLEMLILGDDPDTITVTPATALTCSPVHASVRILAESCSQLPLHLYRRDNDGRSRADDHPLENVIARMANPWTTANTFRLQAMVDLALWGNAFAVIVRNSRKQVIELHRVKPDAVTVKQDDRTLEPFYEVAQKAAPAKRYAYGDVLHLRWLSTDGLSGESPVELAKDEIKLALGIQRYSQRLFRNGGRPPGYLKGPITDKNIEKVKKGFMDVITGKNKAEDVPLLSGDIDFVKVAFSAVEAELQALSLQTLRRILAVYRVPPPIYGDLEKANYSNAEFSGRMFLQHALMPFLKQWEAEIWAKCLTPTERKSLYVEHLVDDLLKADIAARFEAYSKAVLHGILNPNEVRAMENRPSYAEGNTFRFPLNAGNAGGASDA